MDGNKPVKKKRRTMQQFRTEYSAQYPIIRKSTIDCYHAFCTICSADVSVAHGGISDIQKHVASVKHALKAKLREAKPVSSFFAPSTDLSVINAEVLFTDFLVEHSLPFASANHAGPLFKKMFPDSDIAKKYGCGSTKTACIIDSLAKADADSIASELQSKPYSVATDGSNDYGAIKLYPLIVRYFNDNIGRVVCVLLKMLECTESSTGEKIFDLLDGEMSKHSISWTNCLSVAADNASVMQGKSKGVAAYLCKKAPTVYMLGCACHLMHLAAIKAADALKIKVDELLIDIYYYLDKSSKRHQQLKHFQALCDVETHKILKHVSVRWLSIGMCLSRLLEQWAPLSAIFKSEYEAQYPVSGSTKARQRYKGCEKQASKSVKAVTSNTKVSSQHTTTTSVGEQTSCVPGVTKHIGTTTPRDQACRSASATSKQFDLNTFILKEKQVAQKSAAHKAHEEATAEM